MSYVHIHIHTSIAFTSPPAFVRQVIGSDPLGRQVQELRPHLHIFGHTHIPLDLTVDGVRYLQWPLGSVGEQSRQVNVVHTIVTHTRHSSVASSDSRRLSVDMNELTD